MLEIAIFIGQYILNSTVKTDSFIGSHRSSVFAACTALHSPTSKYALSHWFCCIFILWQHVSIPIWFNFLLTFFFVFSRFDARRWILIRTQHWAISRRLLSGRKETLKTNKKPWRSWAQKLKSTGKSWSPKHQKRKGIRPFWLKYSWYGQCHKQCKLHGSHFSGACIHL